MIYCTQCGKENDESSKFCCNCGAKLEQQAPPADEQPAQTDEQPTQTEGVFSGGETESVYEKITNAEEEKPAPIPRQETMQNNDSADQPGDNSYYGPQTAPYYSVEQDGAKQGGGNIGFAIASLICGILSLLCCCLTLFSAVLSIAAIVLGIITLCFKYDGKGMAIAGIITGGIGLVIVVLALIISGTAASRDLLDKLIYEFY